MKKRVLSLSIQAMFGDLRVNEAYASAYIQDEGAGHVLVVPYFEHQPSSVIRIINEPTAGTPVKVRFRGAAGSDDVMDFRLFLSPAGQWQGAPND